MGCNYTNYQGKLFDSSTKLTKETVHDHYSNNHFCISLKGRRLFPFFLLPVQALSTGDLERDAKPIQKCAALGMELICAQSFSHCFGQYGRKLIENHFTGFSEVRNKPIKSTLVSVNMAVLALFFFCYKNTVQCSTHCILLLLNCLFGQ